MPDDNKFRALRDLGHTIPGLCNYCKHDNFEGLKALNGWGTCRLHTYQHLKHENPAKGEGVSIHITETCPQFKWDPNRITQSGLGPHQKFIDHV